jgi:hypothetical protein
MWPMWMLVDAALPLQCLSHGGKETTTNTFNHFDENAER